MEELNWWSHSTTRRQECLPRWPPWGGVHAATYGVWAQRPNLGLQAEQGNLRPKTGSQGLVWEVHQNSPWLWVSFKQMWPLSFRTVFHLSQTLCASLCGWYNCDSRSSQLVQTLINKLSSVFAFKQLGNLDYFLGIEIKHIPNGSLMTTQRKYIHDLLARANMLDAKGIPTPIVSGCKLTKYGCNYVPYPSLYRSTICHYYKARNQFQCK